jgi:nitroreductase
VEIDVERIGEDVLLLQGLRTTRAIRRLRPDPVPRALIRKVCEAGTFAPSGGNRQPWQFVAVTDAETRAFVAERYRRAFLAYIAPAQEAARTPGFPESARRMQRAAVWLAEHLHEVPVHVIPCIEGRFGDEMSNAAAASLYGSIVPAVWSFQLALRSRGLGSAYTTLHLFREAEAAKLLGIPDGVLQVALLPVAWTRGTDFKPAVRPPPESITHWNRWGS